MKQFVKKYQKSLATAVTLAVLALVYALVPETREMCVKALTFVLSGFSGF